MAMYPDPKRIRKHPVNLSLDDYENDLIQSLVNFTGESKAVLCRRMIIAQANATLLSNVNNVTHGRRASDQIMTT